MSILLAMFTAAWVSAAPAHNTVLNIEITRLRNTRGLIQACLSRNPKFFPDCKGDPAALLLSVPATKREIRFSGYAPGRYALTLFHDENSNQRLDTTLGIPQEGFGFSRSPVVRFGAPKFRKVSIDLAFGATHQTVRMQYIL
jgi:uncharacterized protein (DUF2141 family)